ncbi:MAG: MoaD/ThiS family protein [Actinobacteria bacterium]|nr:MoaD/ThiS family protein [Actinomycetota bacterium]
MLLFAHAREAAGVSHDDIDAPTVGALLDAAAARYGETFSRLLPRCRVWVNGDEPADGSDTTLTDTDEVAVLPPVSGG